MKLKLPFLAALATATFALVNTAQAQDKATLDLLVSKGLITAEEAGKLLENGKGKASASGIFPKSSKTQKLTIGGLAQVQYQNLSVDGDTTAGGVSSKDEPAGANRFELRRAQLDFDAKLNDNWGAFISLIAENGASSRDYLDKAGITYSHDLGKLTAGFKKVNFAVEEYTSGSRLFAIERSIATNYFSGGVTSGSPARRLGFASRHTGLYWDGKIPAVGGLEYGVAVTNGFQNSVASASASNNDLSFWGYTQYTAKLADDVSVQFGINLGYQRADDTYVIASKPESSVIGYNPFINAKIGKGTLNAEFIGAAVENGALNGDDANPFGINLTGAYRFGDLEPVIRYSYLDTDGRGLRNNDVWRSSTSTGRYYDKAWTVFLGANYYLSQDSIKVSAGYEYAKFDGDIPGNAASSKADGNGFRVQLQASF